MSRPVFSFRPNLKNPEHEKAWQLLMEIPTGQRNQYLVDVILEQEERETLKRLIQEAVREELKCGDVERMPAQEKEEIPGQMLDFYFRWSRSKGGEAYGQGKYGIVGYAWVLHTFDMDSLVGIVNSFLSNFGVCCV